MSKRNRIRTEIPFAMIPRWIVEHPDLTDKAVRLYGVLHRWAGLPDGIYPTRKRLAEILQCSVASVDRATKDLVHYHAITVEKRLDDAGDPTSNLYTLMSSPVIVGSPTSAATPPPTHAATGSPTDAAPVRDPSLERPISTEIAEGDRNDDCHVAGCDRGPDHSGAHLNPWFDAVLEAFGYDKAPDDEASLIAEVANSFRDSGYTPAQVRDAAAWIVTAWGPEKLTLPSLMKHRHRALSRIALLTGDKVAEYQETRARMDRADRIKAIEAGSLVESTET